MSAMTRAEREDLQRLLRQREKVLKSAAKQRSAELLADFENQMGSEYAFDQDEIWEKAQEAAEREVKKAQAVIAARCRELGIPEKFAPSLGLHWHHRGYGNAIEVRRKELRKMATAQIAAIEQKAVVDIEAASVDAQTKLALAGCTSDAAMAFVDALPAIDTLMPRLNYSEIAGEADPPIAEQLITPNALRQRRFRERHKALRNGATALRAAAVTTPDDEPDGAP
jgi:hypothetical protein